MRDVINPPKADLLTLALYRAGAILSLYDDKEGPPSPPAAPPGAPAASPGGGAQPATDEGNG